MAKDWVKATARIQKAIDKEVVSILQKACDRTLIKFPKAKYVGVREGMGSVWIEIDGLNFHLEDDGRFDVVGYRTRTYRTIRAHRLTELAEAMLECADFLDTFHAGYPDVTAERKS